MNVIVFPLEVYVPLKSPSAIIDISHVLSFSIIAVGTSETASSHVPTNELAAAITIENCFVSLPAALVALAVKLNVFAAVGVPEITPAVERVKPVGNVPVSMLHVIGVSPVTASVWLYPVPTVPFGNDAVVIVGAKSQVFGLCVLRLGG